MKATKQSSAYMNPGARRMAEGGTAKPKRKVMKRNKKTGELTELKGRNADAVREAVKKGKTKDIQGGNALTRALGINKKYNVVSDDKPAAKKKTSAKSSGGSSSSSVRPKARTVARRDMSNTDQMRARTRGKTDTSSPNDKKDPRKTKAKTNTGPAKGVRTKPNAAAQAKIDAYKNTKKNYPGGKDVGRGDPQKAKRKSSDGELARRTTKRASTRTNAIGAPYARQEQIARATKAADAGRKAGTGTTKVDVEKVRKTVGSGPSRKKSRGK